MSSAIVLTVLVLAGGVPLLVAQGGPPLQGVREVSVTGIPDVVAAGTMWTLVWQGTDNADGLVGTPDGSVLFAQEQPRRVSKIAANGARSIVVEGTKGAGSLAVDARGRILAVERTCTDPGSAAPCAEPTTVSIIYPEQERMVLASSFQGKPLGRLNDLVVDRVGRVYFTVGGAYYVSPGGPVASVGDDIRANGIMLSPDEKILYVTNGPIVLAFDLSADGTPTNRRNFGTLEAGGNGDGLAIDAAGRLYVTSNPGVHVFSPAGAYLGLIPTPRSVISVAFSGPDKRMLYVVGSGAVDAAGREITTPPGVRNNAKTIFAIPMLAGGYAGRAK
jgi:gluconolactonase